MVTLMRVSLSYVLLVTTPTLFEMLVTLLLTVVVPRTAF